MAKNQGSPGAPSLYSEELADRIIILLESGKTLPAVSRELAKEGTKIDPATILKWQREDIKGFRSRYVHAREIGYMAWADDIVEITDETSLDRGHNGKVDSEVVNRSKLKVEARKWLLSKALPKVYGDRVEFSTSEPIKIVLSKDDEKL
jgi:hypothetical protein